VPIRHFALTHEGVRRDHNEDAYLADAELAIFAVADGMGGHRAGAVASRAAIETICAFYQRTRDADTMSWPFGFDPEGTIDSNRLATAIRMANRRIWKMADSDLEYAGMGTTLSAVVFAPELAIVSGVGDSRVYLLRDGRLEQLTEDDALLSKALRRELGPEKLATHPYRHVLTVVVGAREEVEVEVTEHPLRRHDLFLLCSDGLHSQVEDEQIAGILASGAELETLARTLVASANEAGGKDNVTVVLVEWDG
jgi:protein phosphatase